MKTLALSFSVDDKRFENGAFESGDFPSRVHKHKSKLIECVFKFLRCSVNGKRLMIVNLFGLSVVTTFKEDQRSPAEVRRKVWSTQSLHHTWEGTWPIGNGSQLKAMYSVPTTLMSGPTNNLLEFHFQRQPKPSRFISSDNKCSLENCKPAAVSSLKQVISLHWSNSVEQWTSHTEKHFLG